MKIILYEGDCLRVLPSINQKFDLIVAGPPYNILGEKTRAVHKVDWDQFTQEEFMDFSVRWMKLCYDKLIWNGSCFVFWSEKNLFLFRDILSQTKFRLHKIIIWHYPNVVKGFSSKRWHNTFDFIFHLVKGEKPKYFNASFVDEENKDVWVFVKPQANFKKDRKVHPTQKPLELIKRIVKMFSEKHSWVLDPFAGSGTTLKACIELGRNCVGIEINSEYIEIIKRRLNWGKLFGVEFKYRKVR